MIRCGSVPKDLHFLNLPSSRLCNWYISLSAWRRRHRWEVHFGITTPKALLEWARVMKSLRSYTPPNIATSTALPCGGCDGGSGFFGIGRGGCVPPGVGGSGRSGCGGTDFRSNLAVQKMSSTSSFCFLELQCKCQMC